MDRPLSVTCLRCRTSDRTEGGGRGAELLARALDPGARVVGSPGEPGPRGFEEDLRESRECIDRAGALVGAELDADRFPVLTASDCSICMTTFPAVATRVPDVRFLWLDAHGDFNSPESTPSGFLGGMCLAAACGVWDAGFGATVDPRHVVMHGVRDLDPGERELVAETGVSMELDDLAGSPVYVHLDLDVLDPSVLPAQFPVPSGLSEDRLRGVLSGVENVVGVEVTAFEAPPDQAEASERADRLASLVRVIT